MQPAFDFTPPHQGSNRLSRHTSWCGAQSANERVGKQALAMLALYRTVGPLTDAEMATALGIERSSVNARRALLVRLGLVEAAGIKKNAQTGIGNTVWQLATEIFRSGTAETNSAT